MRLNGAVCRLWLHIYRCGKHNSPVACRGFFVMRMGCCYDRFDGVFFKGKGNGALG